MRQSIFLFVILTLLCLSCSTPEERDLTGFVNPFIGTAEHGHVFPGAATPFGMVQLSPDNGTSGWDWCSGYNYSDTVIAGFSHTHLSGTGIGDLCDILFMPSMTPFNTELPDSTASIAKLNRSSFSHNNEHAKPGYYSVVLDNGVDVELTVTPRCGIQRYTAAYDGKMQILVDLGFAINWDRPVKCNLQWENNTLTGMRRSSGWASKQYTFFASGFSKKPVSVKMISCGKASDGVSVEGENIACILEFDVNKDEEVVVKTGLSAVDTDGASLNLDAEMPGWNFTMTAAEARQMWQERLEVIESHSYDPAIDTIFYTALYHSMIAPSLYSDIDGGYRGTDLEKHYSDDFVNYTVFSLWDTYRAAHPLFTLTAPDIVPDLINTMLNIYIEQGKLPVWSLTGNETNCMIGYHSVPVIADAIHKNIEGFDYDLAYEASRHSAGLDFRGLNYYREYGYIPSDLENESVSKTLEYAIDDWCIYQMATDLEDVKTAKEFFARSKYYVNVFDTTIMFVRPKMSDGTWKSIYDPLYSQHSSSDFTEGNGWQYTWLVPHDIQGLISLFGGNEMFIQRLDSLFNVKESVRGENASPDISGLIGQYAHGNEPSHHISYMFSAAGAPEKTEYYVREIMDRMYTTAKNGICGNEDCGQMSAWYVFSAMGFYPLNPADGKFVLGSPVMTDTRINLPNGRYFKITVENNSPENRYVDSVYLDNKPLDRNYITYDDIMEGGELKYIMK